MSGATLTPRALHALLQQPGELALLDVREAGVYARGHLLHAASAPLWRLELLIDRLVPRLATPLVLVDGDGTLAHEAAARLQRLGYRDLRVLEGGTAAWQAAGLEVFSGMHVPSKAFGEFVEHEAQTPEIDVATLRRRQARGEPVVLVDGRTPEEFANFTLPGALNLPNGELAYRIRRLAPDPTTPVVVHCAGRTRSLIGAQTLIDAGLPNPVAALRDGTMAWLLAGYATVPGVARTLPEPTPADLQAARPTAIAQARRAGVQEVDSATLRRLAFEPERTLYRFDIRTAAEYRAGHLPGWRWVPGGQLQQATDQYLATRGARIVLANHDGVRAPLVAAWLAQMNQWEVLLHRVSPEAVLQTGEERWRLRTDPQVLPAPSIDALPLQRQLAANAMHVIDVDRSPAFRQRHIEGARFAAPDRLPGLLPLFRGKPLVITSGDGVLAARVAGELRRRGVDARPLRGGNAAWFDARLPEANGGESILTSEDDTWYSPYFYEDEGARHARFAEYLRWETNLPAQLARPGGEVNFRRASAAADALAA